MFHPTNTPLNDADYVKLQSILSRFHGEKAMNLEMVDGFFAALICTPGITPPSVYLPEIWGGGEMAPDEELKNKQELQMFIGLLMRHWNDVSSMLRGRRFAPLLTRDAEGNAKGNDWAFGFLRGIALDSPSWVKLFDDKRDGAGLIPILALANENHSDPELRSYKEPVDAELREKLIMGLSAGAMTIYKYFEPQRRMMAGGIPKSGPKRNTAKTGRNDPCPCGSGRKHKKCCGDTTVN